MDKLPELDSSLFTRENHVNDFAEVLDLHREDVEGKFRKSLREHAVGWCSGERLCFRPIDETVVGLMCEDKDFNKFWFHLAKKKFDEVFETERKQRHDDD